MAKWHCAIDIQKEWEEADKDQRSLYNLAEVISDKLNNLESYPDSTIEEIRVSLVAKFADFASEGVGDVEEFDDLMESLYNWGDLTLSNKDKVCWINTILRM